MTALEGQLLERLAAMRTGPDLWADVFTGERVRAELRESTLPPQDDADRVRRAAAAAQAEWDRYRHQARPGPPFTTPQQAAAEFGRRYGGRWKPLDLDEW